MKKVHLKTTVPFMTVLCSAGLGLALSPSAYAGSSGTTVGTSAYQGKGEIKQYKPGVVVWGGGFVGTSITDARKGPLHNSGWECTGETIIQDGSAHRQGGFCLVTDPDGDTINVIWERTNAPGPAGEPQTKGTYLSGTGKYTGIQGHYTLACKFAGSLALCNLTGGEYKLP